ncbi:MAG: SLBB domain-containing protein [Fibrobacteria bacterium]
MKPFRCFASASIIAMITTTGAMALDLGDLRNSSKMDISDLAGLRGNMDGSEDSPPHLQSDITPYTGDFVLPDSTYIIGPGDQFQIFFESVSMERQVNPEGNILLNRIGVVPLEGLTLKEAKRLLTEKLRTAHKKSECFANLSRPKLMRVFVTGAVQQPGIYQVPGNHRLTDLLTQARGFSNLAQRGKVRIITRKGDSTEVDLRKFMIEGDLNSNPYLPQGGTVHVPYMNYTKPYVMVRRDTLTMPIELEENEPLPNIMLKFTGFTALPIFAFVHVKEADGKEAMLDPTQIADYRPRSLAQVEILPQKRDIYVAGAVLRPGFQPYRSNFKLIQYISDAGLITSSKIPSKIEVTRSNGIRESVSVKEGVLLPGDMVYVDQNAEQRFIIYTPILLSLATLALSIVTIMK